MKPLCLLPLLTVLLISLGLETPAFGQQQKRKGQAPKPTPDLANVPYGPHERHVLDLWKAKSETPTPLVVYIHGGGFRAGSKESVSPGMLKGLLDRGVSVMAVNYRFSPEVTFPAHYMDCARAIQYARLHAKEWNLDGKRVGSTGGSAGAGTSLWLGFHDDLADANNADPVLRQSTRLSCMAVIGAQSTYDPHTITEWIGEAAARHPALEGFYGLKRAEYGTPAAREIFKKAAPITYLTKDDPPVIAFYSEPRGALPANAKPGQGIHHINFGHKLKEQMDKLGIECTIRHRDENPNVDRETVEFFLKHLQAPGKPQS
ncbi:MAG TPA: alpha/beta hydrolase [Prosthecobacter sp.]|nr:alpha/beta hydrolase [Prosthecobacter sp.]